MEKKANDERWVLQDNEEEEEETLSLSDLPLIHSPRTNKEEEEEEDKDNSESQIQEQDFDFCSKFKESEMCAADDVFFQGSILPLRHSIVSEDNGLLRQQQQQPRNKSSASCRSETMDNNRSSSYMSASSSSRSSSVNSSNSSSSNSSSTVTTAPIKRCSTKPKLQPPAVNPFQCYSHPSPSPRLRINRHLGHSIHTKSHSSAWNILKLGLVKAPPPEILNPRPCPRNVNPFGSRNSESGDAKKKKKKQKAGFFGGCKCINDDSVIGGGEVTVRRSASDGEVKALFGDGIRAEVAAALRPPSSSDRKLKKKQQQMSRHRTFQWLKQLSIEGAAVSDDRRQL